MKKLTKIIRYSALYFCVALLTAVGIVFVAKPSSNNKANALNIPQEYEQEEPTAFENLMASFMSAKGFDINFDVDVVGEGLNLPLQGQIYLDLSKGFDNIAVQGELLLSDTPLSFAYVDNWVYISVLDGKYKSSTSNLAELFSVLKGFIGGEGNSTNETDTKISMVSKSLTESTSASIDFSNLDINQIMSSLQSMKDEEIETGHKLSINLLGIDVVILTDESYKITGVDLGEIKLDGYTIVPHLEMSYVEEPKEILVEASEYYDLSQINSLVYAITNTAKLKDWHITTNLKVNMQIASIEKPISMNLPIDAKIKLVDNKPQIMAQIGPIPVIAPVDNDVPYKFGDTVSGLYAGKNRMLNVYYADGYVYFYRSEDVPVFPNKTRTYEKMLKVTLEEFLEDPLMILSYGCGFQDIVMNEIQKSMELAKNRENPIDFKNIILGVDYYGTNCSLVLNLKELANNPQLDTMTLTLKTGEVNGKTYITGGSFNVKMPISSSFKIDIESTDLTLNNIGQSLDWSKAEQFISTYPYKVDEKWQASNNKWELASATTYTVFFEENGGEEVADVTDAVDTLFELPTLSTRVEDDGVTKTTYEFVGWYSSSDFQENSRVTEGKVRRGDIILYAKWNVTTLYYIDIDVVNEFAENLHFHLLEGTEMDIPLQFENQVVSTDTKTTTYAFGGWYVDSNYVNKWTGGKIVPNNNITLYANWKVISVVETRLFNIYDNGVLVSSEGYEVGAVISLPSNLKVDENTKWFLDASYSQETNLPSTMPNEGLNLHIRNKFSVTIVDNTLNNETVVLTGYQGEAITLPTYATRVIDDGTKTKQETFTFAGFNDNLTAFPNDNITITVVWDIETKYYYDVTFSKDNNVVSKFKSHIEFPISELRVLEGTTINLSQYTPTWVYSTGSGIFTVWWHYQFKGWSTSKGGSNISELTVTADTTIYANWNGTVKTGKG